MADRVITLAFLPTPLAALFIEQPLPTDLKLRVLLTGGDKLHHGPKYPLPFELFNHYGPTEYTVVTTYASVPGQSSRNAPGGPKSPPIGRPIFNTQVYVLDGEMNPVPVGVPGELFISGVGLARGYRHRPALTAERFVPNPFSEKPGGRLYRTGDLVRYRPNGQIEFVGRIDHQVKVRGSRIELGEIEAAILQHPAIRQAAVKPVAGKSDNEPISLAAYIVAGETALPTAIEMRRFLQRSLPDYMIPAMLFSVRELPMTPNGKVDRDALPSPDEAQMLAASDNTAARDTLEELLAEAWAELLELDHVGIHQNFFTELGGHSLLATQLISRLRDLLHIELPLQRIFEAPTVAEFAARIRQDPEDWVTVQTVISILLEFEEMSEEDVAVMLNEGRTTSIPRGKG